MEKSVITEEIKKAFLSKVATIPKGKKVALIPHDCPDQDALGGCRALQFYFEIKGIEADIIAVGGLGHPQNTTIANTLNIQVKGGDFFYENKENYALRILCDTSLGHTSLEVEPDIIFDHHNVAGEIPEGCLFVWSDVGAVSTLVYLFLKSLGIKPSNEIALGLLLGIDIDTNYLHDARPVDEQVHDELLDPKDWKTFVRLCFKYDVTRSCISLMGRACSSVEYEGFWALVGLGETTAGSENYYGTIAEYLLREPATRMVIVIGLKDDVCLKVSIRTDPSLEMVDISRFCQEVFEVGSVIGAVRITGGSRNRSSGGVIIPLSANEREEWALAEEDERRAIFNTKVKRFRERIKKFLDS